MITKHFDLHLVEYIVITNFVSCVVDDSWLSDPNGCYITYHQSSFLYESSMFYIHAVIWTSCQSNKDFCHKHRNRFSLPRPDTWETWSQLSSQVNHQEINIAGSEPEHGNSPVYHLSIGCVLMVCRLLITCLTWFLPACYLSVWSRLSLLSWVQTQV